MAPLWRNQIFWSLLRRILIIKPIMLERREFLLQLPNEIEQRHPLRKKLQLLVCRVRNRLESSGLSGEATDLIMSSWREPTQKMYDVYIKKWKAYASRRKVDQIHLFDDL